MEVSLDVLTLIIMFSIGFITATLLASRRILTFGLLDRFIGGMYMKSSRSGSDFHPNALKQYDDLSDEEMSDIDDENDPLGVGPCKMVMVVRTDLKMGKGKMAAQCCHACLGAFRRADEKVLRSWFRLGQTKLVVKVDSEEELRKVADDAQKFNLPYYLVADAGRTQIAAGSETVCAVGPAPNEVVDKVTGKLKLL